MSSTSEIGTRELDRRRNNGIEVALLWSSRTNRVTLEVYDEREGHAFELDVQAGDALYAFRHPYAYAELMLEDQGLAA
jgi:hypothetical protein